MITLPKAEQLQQHFSEDIRACESLLALMDSEQEALGAKDAETLQRCIEEKAKLLQHLEQSAQTRSLWANTIGLSPDTSSARAQINSLLTAGGRADLRTAWQRLQELTRQCREKNDANGKAITRQQQIYGRLMNILRGQPNTPNLYSATGKSVGSSSGLPLDEA